ncbi:MAG: Hsp33 family molecular chaperone HslO [Bacillota bacterium]|nr:Hsp33 family molecular chaperone HslO [Bacillota bacterium]
MRAVVRDSPLVGLAVRLTRAVGEARRRHRLSALATAALGRALAGAALLAATLKGDESITIRVVGDGPLGGIIAEGRAGGAVRGYVENAAVELPPTADHKLDVSRGVGRGYMYVTRDMGLKEPYTGRAPLVSGEIAGDLAYYLATSEQTPSAVALGVLVEPRGRVRAAGGLLVQALPGGDDRPELAYLEDNLRTLPAPSALIEQGNAPEDIMLGAFAGYPASFSPPQPVRYRCRCTRARLLEALATIDLDDAEEGEILEARCHFCGHIYRVPVGEVRALLKRPAAPSPP